tara:strand:- start:4572 stop:5255 length:684 start_codon:yes stop_codon:yes gene_type:complete
MGKQPIKFNIPLSAEQKEAKAVILTKDVNFLLGGEGSGKTMLSVNVALDLFFRKDTHYDKIIITRPAVATEDFGYLPGDMNDKLGPYLAPIYETITDIYGNTDVKKNKIARHFENNEIRILPIAFTRGVTYSNAIVIIDEFQNCTQHQMEMIIGRLGKSSKLIFAGSKVQIDLPRKSSSAVHSVSKLEDNEYTYIKELQSNHRHAAVVSILDTLRKKEEQYEERKDS